MSTVKPPVQIQVRVLGPVQVCVAGRPVELPPLVRGLVAVLAADAGRVVSVETVADALWHGRPPASARNRVQQVVSTLRRLVAETGFDGVLVTTAPPGYVLAAPAETVDVLQFSRLVSAARRQASHGAVMQGVQDYQAALQLWRGRAFHGVDVAGLEIEAARLEEVRLCVIEECLESQVDGGQYSEVIADLTRLVVEHPLRERLRGLLMQALSLTGREAEALATYRSGYDLSTRDVGVEPGTDLQALHQAILTRQPWPQHKHRVVAPAPPPTIHSGEIPRQLPMSVPDFTGRTAQTAALRSLLVDRAALPAAATVVVVIGGMGGVGKSTLAIRAAAQAAEAYPHGCLFTDLRGTTGQPATPHAVLGSFLRALGAASQIPLDPDARLALYRSTTAGRRLLVVLDDAAGEAQVRPLIPAAGSAVIVTARPPLLGLESAARIPLDMLSTPEGIEFLAAVAGRNRVQDTANAERVVQLCGGLPLAVRIAGARLGQHREFTTEQFVARLSAQDGLLDTLAAGDRSVRACLQLSYTPLDADAANLFRLLGTLPGEDLTVGTCAAVLDRTAAEARQPLERLIAACLVGGTQSPRDEPRYRLHSLVRRFATEKAAADEPWQAPDNALRRLTDYYTDAGFAAGQLLSGGRFDYPTEHQLKPAEPRRFRGDKEAMTWFTAERANVLAAVVEAAKRGLHTQTWRLAYSMRHFYRRGSELDDWLATHELALASAQALIDAEAEFCIRESLGSAHLELNQPAEAIRQWTITLRGRTEMGDEIGRGRSHDSLGTAYARLGDLDLAVTHHRAALALPEYAAHPQYAAMCRLNLGAKYGQLGAYDDAHDAFEQALQVATSFDDFGLVCFAEHNLAELCMIRGNHTEAQAHAQAEIDIARKVRYPLREARGWDILATILHDRDPTGARTAWQRALDLYESLAHPLAQTVQSKLAGNYRQPPQSRC